MDGFTIEGESLLNPAEASMFEQFKAAANALCQSAKLRAEVAELQGQLASTKSENERLKADLDHVTDQLVISRRNHDDASRDRDSWRQTARAKADEIDTLVNKVDTLSRERDEYGLQNLALADERDSLKVKLENVASIVCVSPPPKPEPIKADPPQQVRDEGWDKPYNDPWL